MCILLNSFSRASFRGWISLLTNEEFCKSLERRFDTLLKKDSDLKPMELCQIDFQRSDETDKVLKRDDIEFISNVAESKEKELAVVRVLFLPNKQGIAAGFSWNSKLEIAFGSDFQQLFEKSKRQWSMIAGRKMVPPFWGMFSKSSFLILIKWIFDAYFGRQFHSCMEMECITWNGDSCKAKVVFKATSYPLIEMPESYTIAIFPI
jgi:hypothetical protein